MAASKDNFLAKTENFVKNFLRNHLSEDLLFHNLKHTEEVVEAANTIAKYEGLSDKDVELILIAAWFHDTGYDLKEKKGHEDRSVEMAKKFLLDNGYNSDEVITITDCILATKEGFVPSNILQKVICDADMYHIAKEDYEAYLENLRIEIANIEGDRYTELDWIKLNISFFEKKKFYTKYGNEYYDPARGKLLKRLKKKLTKRLKKLDQDILTELGISKTELKSLKNRVLKGEGRSDRGVETMFRLTSRNHIDLSGMADNKANIMISVNSIIISILIGALMQKLDNNPHLIIPTIILLLVCLGSIIFSILSLRPNITSGISTREEIEKNRTNLLFFGNFHKMTREDYHWGMNQLIENGKSLYSSLIDDIFFIGVVLAKKYKLLRISYNIFMYGIVVAVLSFIIANLLLWQ